MREQHAELRAPVADVILAYHLVTEFLQYPRQCIANDCAAQMPNVHFLGKIRAGIVDHHSLRLGNRVHQGRISVDALAQESIT